MAEVVTGDSADAPAWLPAIELLDDITRRTEAGAVVRAAYRAGLLERLLTPSSVAELARTVVVEQSRLVALLEVLQVLGISSAEADTWTLTPAWAAAMEGQSPLDLAGYLEGPRVRMSQFEQSLTGGDDYWHLPQQERLLLARAVSFNPASPSVPDLLRRDLGLLDGVVPALEAGGRVLELGCGVGSRLTALALTFPTLHGVGVELDGELAAFGRRRAEQLGVADRLTYVVGDATWYRPDGAFDLVNWSQFFFPDHARAGAVAAAWDSLRPGGWVTAPVIWADEPGSLIGDDAADLALEALNLDMWGVPARTVGQVRAELESAGFVDTRVDDMGFVLLVRGRRPPDGP